MIASLPFRLGYFLECGSVSYLDMAKIYRGVDRLWFGPDPEYDDAEVITEPSEGYLAVWDHYSEVEYDKSLHKSRIIAEKLRSDFAKHGMFLDCVYLEIVECPKHRSEQMKSDLHSDRSAWFSEGLVHWRSVHDSFQNRPDDLVFLGYDVSWPLPRFHSVLFQPGLNKKALAFEKILNENGLLGNRKDARVICQAAYELDYSPPFCILGVWGVV